MLLVPCRLAPSKVHGIGVYTVKSIRKYRVIWEYTEGIDRRIFTDNPTEFENHFGYIPFGKKYIEIPGDHIIFMNHADYPNIMACGKQSFMMAIRDIAAGEELTCSYDQLCSDPFSGGPLRKG